MVIFLLATIYCSRLVHQEQKKTLLKAWQLFIYKLFSQNCNFLPQIAVVLDNGAVYLHIQRVSTDLPIKKEKNTFYLPINSTS